MAVEAEPVVVGVDYATTGQSDYDSWEGSLVLESCFDSVVMADIRLVGCKMTRQGPVRQLL